MATTGPNTSMTFVAAIDFLSADRFKIVELTANPLEVTIAAADTGYGVIANNPLTGEHGTVTITGETKVIAGVAMAVGDRFTSAASGFAVPVNSGAARPAGATAILGRALTATASGGYFTGYLQQQLLDIASGAAV